jgi:hypothetical protein
MARALIVLGDSLANFCGGYSNNRIAISVVIRIAPEHLNPQRAFLEVVGPACQGLGYHVSQETRVTLTVIEAGSLE